MVTDIHSVGYFEAAATFAREIQSLRVLRQTSRTRPYSVLTRARAARPLIARGRLFSVGFAQFFAFQFSRLSPGAQRVESLLDHLCLHLRQLLLLAAEACDVLGHHARVEGRDGRRVGDAERLDAARPIHDVRHVHRHLLLVVARRQRRRRPLAPARPPPPPVTAPARPAAAERDRFHRRLRTAPRPVRVPAAGCPAAGQATIGDLSLLVVRADGVLPRRHVQRDGAHGPAWRRRLLDVSRHRLAPWPPLCPQFTQQVRHLRLHVLVRTPAARHHTAAVTSQPRCRHNTQAALL